MSFKPRLEYFPKHSAQPLSVRFDFTPQTDRFGLVSIRLRIADRWYGPYRTSLRTTVLIWQGRKLLSVPKASQVLMERLADLQTELERAWHGYNAKAKPISGVMVLANSTLIELQDEGGPLYAL